jgi:hypothetical protein
LARAKISSYPPHPLISIVEKRSHPFNKGEICSSRRSIIVIMAKKVVKPSSSTASSSSSTNGTRDKPPPLDQWIVPAIGLALAMLGYHFMRGMMQHEIVRVNLEDELELREVFFGEDTGQHNYAVLCHPEHAKYPLSSVFSDAAKEGPSSVPALFRVIDCDHVLMGSEKSIKERFKLSDKSRPVVFVSGKIGPPKQVSILYKRRYHK